MAQTLTGVPPLLRLVVVSFALRLVVVSFALFAVHFAVLAYGLGQRQVYADLLHKVFGRRPALRRCGTTLPININTSGHE